MTAFLRTVLYCRQQALLDYSYVLVLVPGTIVSAGTVPCLAAHTYIEDYMLYIPGT